MTSPWQQALAAPAAGHVDVHDTARAIRIDALQPHDARIRLGIQAAGELDRLAERRAVAEFVDRRPAHLPRDDCRAGDRGHEDRVALAQLQIFRSVAAQEQIVEIERRHRRAAALELDVTQRADRRHAAAGEQRVGDGRQAADGVRARPLHVADDEDSHRAQLAHGDAGAHADHLPRNAAIDLRTHPVEREPGDLDRAELRHVQRAVATHDQQVAGRFLAEQLDGDVVAGTDAVVGGHRYVVGRRERRRHLAEHLVAERLQRFDADRLYRQQRHHELQAVQPRVGIEQLRRLNVGQTGEIDRRQRWQRQAALLVQPIGIARADPLAAPIEQCESRRVQRRRLLRHGDIEQQGRAGDDARRADFRRGRLRRSVSSRGSRRRSGQLSVAASRRPGTVAHRLEHSLLLVGRQVAKGLDLVGRLRARRVRNRCNGYQQREQGAQEHRQLKWPDRPHG